MTQVAVSLRGAACLVVTLTLGGCTIGGGQADGPTATRSEPGPSPAPVITEPVAERDEMTGTAVVAFRSVGDLDAGEMEQVADRVRQRAAVNGLVADVRVDGRSVVVSLADVTMTDLQHFATGSGRSVGPAGLCSGASCGR